VHPLIHGSPSVPADVADAFTRAGARRSAVPIEPRWFAALPSTMDIAADLAHTGAPEGLVVVAEEQTAGRGRRGRVWSSPAGAGLYLSFILRPPRHASDRVLSLLTLATGVAVRGAIEEACGFAPELKWPNDVMVGRRKLAGVLAEGSAIGTAEQCIVIGVGLNVLSAAHPGEIARRATSLEEELGRLVERGPLLEALLVAVPHVYARLLANEADDILREWRAAAPSARGARVEWVSETGTRCGTTIGVGDDGALLIRTREGDARVIAGELRWL
jgi:BirA family transcriptional regulator, biotin operon repressor / biotin---[acetyl-CoA-carboxylase] ligase